MFTAEVQSWLHAPDPKRFPYDAVVRHFHSVGKHFVPTELLDLLAEARDRLPTLRGPWTHVRTLSAFLSTALDKPDKQYDYPTYLALSLLPLPAVDDPMDQAPFARSRCDRLTVQLIADTLAFEIAAGDRRTTLLPQMRPSAELVTKRCKHGLRAIQPALRRLSLDRGLSATEPVALARQVCSVVRADIAFAEQQALDLSVLPVHTAHDEYMFLRVLQAFETTFALLAVQLRGVVAALSELDVDRAVHFLTTSRAALAESAPLFSMLATMQVESFRTFRQFTDGASAIQSRNYKLVEALCRQPDRLRVDSPAFHSVPDVRQRVLAGHFVSLDERYRAVRGDLSSADRDRLTGAMKEFARAMLRWRNTHYRLAVRMLGEASGTGYTEGTPYLQAVRTIPVFETVAVDEQESPAGRR
ncbi:tryptophan 2,3-dioxygenase [Kutzneria buriramensis]|uniref:Tryptophan 2,3-dioxygenase n=1 Tax=Kutzneria buriramensis TaxID=1045776 RepID=A0A3E0HHU8_9PSEU|nr:tryptophan 2,3-dioxygenase [Kutzneria buriramensis]REH46021.1 tryptophan 2,3-dioxygenase [Kutzneria buriramensis]